MENKKMIDFNAKFNELNSGNQKYIIAIIQALGFAQTSAVEEENIVKKECLKNILM